MTEKNEQEKMAAERQVELLSSALDKAVENGGVWLNSKGKTAPQFYKKSVTISPFNAIVLGLHSDQNGYKTNEYTLFSEAKKRGESVQTKVKMSLAVMTTSNCPKRLRTSTRESEAGRYEPSSTFSRPPYH